MIKNDKWILQQCSRGMISPYEPALVRRYKRDSDELACVSYGVSSYGYDIRLSPKEFKVFKRIPGLVVNPKSFNNKSLEAVNLHSDEWGDYFVIPANSYGLGVSLEKITMPVNVTAICIGKSTYARVGIIANLTPVEAAWVGYLTLEFSNSSSADCRIYANEGVAQLLFFEGDMCRTSYQDRQGKYQNQEEQITLPVV